ncbi:vWA domain-containing protein [Methylobacterium thuringiense]|uniref:VWFA domain-containing protein n=2 Tax=Methylobacterium TaxID=407 RepID=A0ABQ4TUH2_9HYPH|nr:VWA domain-containing protein [Methylobacterium thuringiense]GJE57540.1 hypothetical protein EKPJFOCH_4057 [Methylobacterium thuringiense]
MTPIRTALAASVVVIVAAPIAWQLSREHQGPVAPPAETPSSEPAAPRPTLDIGTPTASAPPAEPSPGPETAKPEATGANSMVREAEPQSMAARDAPADATRKPAEAPVIAPPPPTSPLPASPLPATRIGRDQVQAFRSSGFADWERRGQEASPPQMRARALSTAPDLQQAPAEPTGHEKFDGKPQSGFQTVQTAPVSTFSIDVDTASYGFVRASLARDTLPPPAAVRTEELINYFPYGYPAPENRETPFRVTASVFPSPWAEGRKIVRVGIKGYALQAEARPKANLVFLVDTSGSMNGPNRLPLVKRSLALLLTQLDARDRVAIVTYAGQAGTVLEPTAASDKQTILSAIEGLGAGGSTAGGEGLRQAYALAERNFDPSAVNRVMLATDGDFNVGITDRDELKGFVERKRETGIFLSVLGFGMGNTNDSLMQALAQNGNGTAATIDTLNEARKVLVEEATATLFPIAKDVKIQVEFNPAAVAEYRLIGYETRALNREDFENDRVDAGEVGSGQTATALYEIVPVGGPRTVPPLRYGAAKPESAASAGDYAFVKIRYKRPDQDVSQLIETPVGPAVEQPSFDKADDDARFATAVAGFGEILRNGRWTGRFGLDDVIKIATSARGEDPYGYRSEFVQLVRAAKTAQALRSSRP